MSVHLVKTIMLVADAFPDVVHDGMVTIDTCHSYPTFSDTSTLPCWNEFTTTIILIITVTSFTLQAHCPLNLTPAQQLQLP